MGFRKVSIGVKHDCDVGERKAKWNDAVILWRTSRGRVKDGRVWHDAALELPSTTARQEALDRLHVPMRLENRRNE